MTAPSGAGTAAAAVAVGGDGAEEVCAAARPAPVNSAADAQRIPFLTTVLGFKGWNWIAPAPSRVALWGPGDTVASSEPWAACATYRTRAVSD
jgi:hypothetical protein